MRYDDRHFDTEMALDDFEITANPGAYVRLTPSPSAVTVQGAGGVQHVVFAGSRAFPAFSRIVAADFASAPGSFLTDVGVRELAGVAAGSRFKDLEFDWDDWSGRLSLVVRARYDTAPSLARLDSDFHSAIETLCEAVAASRRRRGRPSSVLAA